jgi:hypothetical protein
MLGGALTDVWVGPCTGLNVWGWKMTDKCHEMKFLSLAPEFSFKF